MNFEHFLITRYNLKKEDWKSDVENREVLDANWLNSRNDLFLKFCLPSVINQKCLKFKWLIFFQEGSQKAIKSVISELKNYDFIEVVFLKSYEEFQKKLPSIIKSRLKKDTSRVLTTRLDNDDALNSEFVLSLQEVSKKNIENTVFHFPDGLLLDLTGKLRLASSYYPMNQFLSFMEFRESSELVTVLGREHDQWGTEFNIMEIRLRDAWLQITHSRNLSNQYFGHPAYSKRLDSFSFKKPKFPMAYNWKIFLKKLNLKS